MLRAGLTGGTNVSLNSMPCAALAWSVRDAALFQKHKPPLTFLLMPAAPAPAPAPRAQKIMYDWTDPSLGNCSYLDTCRNMRTCRHVHYKLDALPDVAMPDPRMAVAGPARGGAAAAAAASGPGGAAPKYGLSQRETQWINCDVRSFDMTVLGKFGVIMADPPWEIHQVGRERKGSGLRAVFRVQGLCSAQGSGSSSDVAVYI